MTKYQKKTNLDEDPDSDLEVSFDVLAEAISGKLREESMHVVDPFERYCILLRLSLISNIGDYGDDILKGYRVLIREIEKFENN
jgi:hypothetical protein